MKGDGRSFWEVAEKGPPRRVCLIIPPSAFLLDERVFVSLGILKVASTLEMAGHHVHVLDLSGVENYLDAVAVYLDGHDDHVIGLTCTTPQLPYVLDIAKAIRAWRPEIRLILGGPHVTLTYSAVRYEEERSGDWKHRAKAAARQLEDAFDVVCAGDGELAALKAVEDDCPKLLDGDDHRGKFFLSDLQFESSPPPARHLVDLKSYRYTIEDRPSTSLIAQLGCPFGCGFCGGRASKSLRLVRSRGPESIVKEVEFLHKTYGYTGFMFYDDELNVSKSMVALMHGLVDLQDRLGVEFRFRGFVKSELFNDEQAEVMVKAGFRWLLCGFESADERILVNINKRATLSDNSRAVEIAKKHGMKVKALMSIGHPGEREESALGIRDWLVDMEVDDFDCTIITTYPGTPYFDQAIPHESLPGVWTYVQPQTGDRLHSMDVDFSTTPEYYKGDPDGGYRSFVFTDYLSSKEIVNLRDHIEREARAKLKLDFNLARAAARLDKSMGRELPDFVLRGSDM